MLLIFSGLPGTGKSALARAVSERIGAVWLRVDTLEASMLKAGLARSFETGLAAYLGVEDIAEEELRLGHTVVVDAVNGVEEGRQMWRQLAARTQVPRFVVEVFISDTIEHRRRVESRTAPTPPLPKPTWDEVITREYLPWNEPVLAVDGVQPIDVNVPKILSYCRTPPSPAR